MVKIIIKHNESLETTNNKLRTKISSKNGNTLQRDDTGLYAKAEPGRDGSSGKGYPDGYQSANGLISGVQSFEQFSVPSTGRIAAHSCVHRIFTATNENGDGIPLRENIDILYPGDMFRYHDDTHGGWVYRIITKTNGTDILAKSGIVAAIPDSYTNAN